MPRRAKGPRLYLRERGGRDPVWVIRDGSSEHSTGCGASSRGEADQALARYIASKYQPQPRSELASILVSETIATYLREHAPTVKNPEFLGHTARPITIWWQGKSLADVRGRTCREYVEWRTAQGVSTQTARHDLKTLRAAIGYWHREYGPLTAVPIVTLPERAAPKDRHLSRDEARKLLLAALRVPHLARFILIGIYTGTRRSAILGLKWTPALHTGWVDLEAGIIHRRGRAEVETKKQRPPCRIPAALLPYLRRWKARDMAAGRSDVIHYEGDKVVSLKRSWRTACVAAGLGPDVTPHTLRHTCVSWLLQDGVPPAEVASFVGMSLQMVDDVYGHLGPEHQARAAGR